MWITTKGDVDLYPENQGYEIASNLLKQLWGRRNSLETRLPGSTLPPGGQLMVRQLMDKAQRKDHAFGPDLYPTWRCVAGMTS